MHTFFKTTFAAFVLIASVVTINSSCNKQFDQPPVYVAPTVTANTTIKQLKALHVTSGSLDVVSQDIIIRGIVIADDKSGNLYKTIVIQDATGGITLLLGGNNLFNTYPIGREIFVNCKGLYLGDYNRVIQLGGGIDASGTTPALADIPSTLFSKYIIKGSFGNVVAPRVVTAASLGTNMQDTLINTLIQINNSEFGVADTSKTYALPNQNPPGTANFTIKDCSGGSITLRNSGYAAFAGYNVPNGNGSIVSVYTVFGTTKQLTIRDTFDLKFYGARCGSGGGTPPPAGGTTLLNENFETVTTTGTTAIALTGWKNIGLNTGVSFLGKSFSNNKYAQVSAFNSTVAQQLPTVKSWLITPVLNLTATTNEVLTFGTIDGFNNGATLKVLYSTNYDGGATPSTATWVELPATIASGTANGYAPSFTNSGNISLAAINGTAVYIAFVYDGGYSPSAKTTTYQIDNVLIVAD
jgi:hypothetical protein